MSECGCLTCLQSTRSNVDGTPVVFFRMILCEHCGNKRCPHATNHEFRCTGSNEPMQVPEYSTHL